jgi:hypothetical protein
MWRGGGSIETPLFNWLDDWTDLKSLTDIQQLTQDAGKMSFWLLSTQIPHVSRDERLSLPLVLIRACEVAR